jgi:hypothetical protein
MSNPTDEQINGFELAMEYMTYVANDNLDGCATVITQAFVNAETALAYVVAMSNFCGALNMAIAANLGLTPGECWMRFAQGLQANRPPEWER